jgi:hypothetical protein
MFIFELVHMLVLNGIMGIKLLILSLVLFNFSLEFK